MQDFLNKIGGRKFFLTLLFTVIVFANKLLAIGMSWQELLVLAGMFGLYSGANAVKALSDKTETVVNRYENIYEYPNIVESAKVDG